MPPTDIQNLPTRQPQIAASVGAGYAALFVEPGVLEIASTRIPDVGFMFEADKKITFGTWPAVATWGDRSGLSARDLTGLNSPNMVVGSAGINGRPGLLCVPGTATYFRNNAVNINLTDRGARTIYFVGKSLDAAGGYQVSSRLAAGAFLAAHRNSAGTIFSHLGASGDNQTMTDLPTIAGVPHIWRHTHDGRHAFIGADCLTRVAIDGVDHGISGGGYAVAETGTTGFCVGGFDGDTGNTFNGPVGMAMQINRVVSKAEDRLIMGYLSQQWAIAYTSTLLDVCCLGDSGFYGSVDATTLANGGPRSRIYGAHPSWQSSGSFYAPHGGNGSFNRCEGNVGFNSGAQPVTANGIGGSYLVTSLLANPADLYLIQIGENDALLSLFTAAQTAANVRAITDTIYAMLPSAKCIVARSVKASSGSAAANVVIQAQGPALVAAMAGAPNVLGPVLIPPDFADGLYQGDGIHLLDPGQAIHCNSMWLPGITSAGYVG